MERTMHSTSSIESSFLVNFINISSLCLLAKSMGLRAAAGCAAEVQGSGFENREKSTDFPETGIFSAIHIQHNLTTKQCAMQEEFPAQAEKIYPNSTENLPF
ncbi:MAG: hypothetical protein IJA48_01460 [Oscillospiraceae bacterium]|nr:hypothetical protein [Oscillospiraceae bacterium]